jgi:exopolysaccharide biosynthesis polyprenyl glycosylphosphotransferase
MTSDVRLGEPPDPAFGAAAGRLPHATTPAATAPAAAVVRRATGPRWERRYARLVITSDLISIAAVVPIGILLHLGTYDLNLGAAVSPWLPLLCGLLTVCCLALARAWEAPVLGQGSEEFSRLVRAVVSSAVLVGMAGLAFAVPSVRPWALGLIPLMGVLCMIGRYSLRRWLHAQRVAGLCLHSALVVGSVESVTDLINRTRRDRHNGWSVDAACTPGGTGADGAPDIAGVPVVGDLDAVAEVVRRGGYHVVAIGRASGWTPRRMHQLAWDLEGLGADLVVDPGLMEVAGPRLHVAPVDGLPLLRLTQPALDGVSRVVKATVDRIGAAVLLLLTAPVLVALAITVKADGGPVFFRQIRVGRHGERFRMVKFRSMVPDAESIRDRLAADNEGAGPLFKIRSDPRVTRTGAWLRKYSLDELPQLVNVLTGTMSLVGPRPPLPEEVATYDREARRKLMVRPGLTGLWQVSGRSDLSWEESVRLDLRYVENWSLALDLLILWKTAGTVIRGNGAY